MDFKTTKERLAWREAFLSLNERKIRAECNRRNVILPEDDFSFWKSVHKSITAFEKLDITLWARSALWLKQNGSSPLTDRWAELHAGTFHEGSDESRNTYEKP